MQAKEAVNLSKVDKRLIAGLSVVVALALSTNAAAEMWRCPCGGEEFALDDRDSDFKESFKRDHVAVHCTKPVPPPPPPPSPAPSDASTTSPAGRDNSFENQQRNLGATIRRPSPSAPEPAQDQFSRDRSTLSANIRRLDPFETGKAKLGAAVSPKSSATSWSDLWRSYQNGRDLARGIAPEANRCAIALSAALDVRPRKPGEFTLKDVEPEILNEGFRGVSVLTRYYVRAEQLAERLEEQPPFGKPPEIFENAQIARRKIAIRRGIIYYEDADLRLRSLSRTGDHIDIWDQYFNGSPYAFNNKARRIWFWEFPDGGR